MCDSHLTGESFVGAANVLHYLLRKEHKMQIIPLCAKEFVSFGMSEIKLKLSKFRTEKKERENMRHSRKSSAPTTNTVST